MTESTYASALKIIYKFVIDKEYSIRQEGNLLLLQGETSTKLNVQLGDTFPVGCWRYVQGLFSFQCGQIRKGKK